jgi:hypothetical protein
VVDCCYDGEDSLTEIILYDTFFVSFPRLSLRLLLLAMIVRFTVGASCSTAEFTIIVHVRRKAEYLRI